MAGPEMATGDLRWGGGRQIFPFTVKCGIQVISIMMSRTSKARIGMAEQILVPTTLLADFLHLPAQLPEQMIKDLIAVSQVPHEDLSRLAEMLQKQEGFLDMRRLATQASLALKQESHKLAAVATITNLRASRLDKILQGLQSWHDASPRNAERLPDVQAVADALRIIVRDYPALARYRKAQHLASLTGQKVESVDFLCDLRPVFDKDRQSVEGVIALTTIRITLEQADESTKVFEAVIPEGALDELIEKARKAKQKLDVLGTSVSDWLPLGWVRE